MKWGQGQIANVGHLRQFLEDHPEDFSFGPGNLVQLKKAIPIPSAAARPQQQENTDTTPIGPEVPCGFNVDPKFFDNARSQSSTRCTSPIPWQGPIPARGAPAPVSIRPIAPVPASWRISIGLFNFF